MYVQAFNISQPKPDFTVTNFGLHIQLPITSVPENPGYHHGFLACSNSTETLAEWAVIYLYCKPGSKTRRFIRTTFQGRWIGSERVLNREFDSNPFYLLLYEDTWPLSWQQLTREPFLQSALPSTSILETDRTITLILAKSHQNIEIVDACPEDYFTSRNEILLDILQEDWAMKMEPERATSPSDEGGNRFAAAGIKYGGDIDAPSKRLATVIVDNGIVGGRMLIVFAIFGESWHIFLSELKKDLNARSCRKRLLYPPSAKADHGQALRPSSAFSRFVGLGIPFGYGHSSTSLGRYFVTVDRQIRLGSRSLEYRITVGLKQFPHLYINVDSYEAQGMMFFGKSNSSQDWSEDSSQDSDSLSNNSQILFEN
jgi:hypothetical protein